MTRGGKREGAGRPKTKGEKLTVPIPVRVTPSEFSNIKLAAAELDMPLARFVRLSLALRCVAVLRKTKR